MMGDGSDDDDNKEDEDGEQDSGRRKASNDDSGCSWGMGALLMLEGRSVLNTVAVTPVARFLSGLLEKHNSYFCFLAFLFILSSLQSPSAAEEAVPEEDENAENPFSTEFREDQEAAYLKDPKKALQGFYDREGK